MHFLPSVLLSVLLLGLSGIAFAEAQANLQATMQQACLDKDEGDLCSFENIRGESINGQCKRSNTANDNSKLTCVETN